MRAELKERGLRVRALSRARRRGKAARAADLNFASVLLSTRKLDSGPSRLYSRRKEAGKRMNLGRPDSLEKAGRLAREM